MKTAVTLIALAALTGCASTGGSKGAFYDEAEQFNRAAAMYCPEDGVRTYMSGKNGVLFIVCKDGSRYTVNGGL